MNKLAHITERTSIKDETTTYRSIRWVFIEHEIKTHHQTITAIYVPHTD